MTQVVGMISPNTKHGLKRQTPSSLEVVPNHAGQVLSLSDKKRRTTYALAIHTALDVDTSGAGVRTAVLKKVPESLKDMVDLHLREQVHNHEGKYPWHDQAQQIANTIVEMEDELAYEDLL
jgi:hypothetical protein